MTRSRQTTDGIEYGGGSDPSRWMTYTYNLSGAMTEQQYPSGRVVRNVLDNDGSLSMVQSKRNASFGYHAYASSFTYNAAGAVTSMQLGNGRWESTVFNSRLQPTQIALGSTGTGAHAHDLLKLDYGYGGANNNGNVLSQTITVPSVTISGTTHNGYTPFRGYARLFAEWLCLSVGCPKVSRGWAALLRQSLGGSGRKHGKAELFRSARGEEKDEG